MAVSLRSKCIVPTFFIICLSLSAAGFAQPPEGPPRYKSPDEAQYSLDAFCSKFNMSTRAGQEMCMQETYGQSYTFAKSFAAALGFTRDNRARKERQWRDKASDEDYVAVIGYDRTCSQLLSGVFNPGETLDFKPSTAIGLPKYCIEEAEKISDRYDVAIDDEEAARLERHIKRLESYYKRHPDIPDATPSEEKNFPLRM